ncbi:immunoglobulin-like and fibronectin type III domain-containing protein 1 [Chanos chanos]|uniref:immunoglobulin-like and fibronectin type III domain-containing protein 1 n=1 Tax=Chanos chanos TaxID=29144 RepID=UPI0011F14BB9|nr:immunoglobulin-like and fibronectin type III domain-containing protein 1 [Chanos chanos]
MTTPAAGGQASSAHVEIKRRSRVPGVMITQFVEELPKGKTTPDFMRKPIAITIQEGKTAFFKAVVTGDPKPTVVWARNNGDLSDPEKYHTRYEERAREHILEIPHVTVSHADTYKCYASNEFGRAVCTATLHVIEVGFKKKKPEAAASSDPEDFRKLLKKTTVVKKKKQKPKKEGEIDPKFWEILLSAQKKDYERICAEFGITDFRWMLKRLNQLKKEREEEQAKVVESVGNTKQIEVTPHGKAEFEINMKLKDPKSKVFLYKDGEMLQYGDGNDDKSKHNMKKTGDKYLFSINNLSPDDAGLYQVDVEEASVFSTDFKIPDVEFTAHLKDVKATECQDAIFECILSSPLPNISWFGKDVSLEKGEKYDITVSEDKLTHKLVVKDCKLEDKGTYAAVVGLKSSKATLSVEEDPNKRGAGGGDADLSKFATDQNEKQQKEKDDVDAAKTAQAGAEKGDGGDGTDGSGLGDGAGVGDGVGKDGGDGVGKDGGDGSDKDGLGGDGTDGDGTGGDGSGDDKNKKRTRTAPLVPDSVIDPGVQFISGLSDTAAKTGQTVEFACKLSSDACVGVWYKDGKKLTSTDGLKIIKDGPYHKLIIENCQEGDAGTYRFEADGRKSEAVLIIQDPPRIDPDALGEFSKPVIVRAGENAAFKLPFAGKEPMKIQWYKADEELLEGLNVKIEKSPTHSRLLLSKCQRKDTSEVKIKIKNEFGTIEATSKLIVLDKPSPPQGPVEIIESSLSAIEFKWRPPKDDGGCPVTNYLLERQQLGRNTWTKIGEIPENPTYRDTDIDRGRKYSYRIRAKNAEGISEMMTTNDIAAGILAFPGQPAAPKIISAFKDCINLEWLPPSNTGGSSIVGYNLEKRKKGSNLWNQVNPHNEPIKEKKYAVKDVIEGAEYEFRVTAINVSGAGEPSVPSAFVTARDPKKPPGKVIDLKITESTYTTLCLAWTKPKVVKEVEDEAKGYFVEIRPLESIDWSRCNSNAVIQTSYTIVGLKSMGMYWVRVIATNEGGEGLPQGFDNYIIAMPPPVKPRFTDSKMKSFMVVRCGNTARVNIKFEASPLPDITWLKDGSPVAKHVTITNSDRGSQLLIPTAEHHDSGIYTITVKNMVGQETFNIEIRVSDDPKPPGPVELEQDVPGTLTVCWTSSPDEKRDDRLHYMVTKRDSVNRKWRIVADRLFNNKCTVINVLPGREYHFRVFAKNDMGLSEPSESPTWGTQKKREKFTLSVPESQALDLQAPPKFIVPLKMHVAPNGYECYMSCAVTGNPTPHVTWYRNNVSLNTNTNYYITNVCGVCSMLILRVGPKDTGEYKVVADSPLGQTECSTKLTVREEMLPLCATPPPSAHEGA